MHTIHAPRIQLDPTRIASISGAIAVNGLLLLLLIAPMSPVMKAVRDAAPDVIFVSTKPKENPTPPKQDTKPVRVEITHPTPMIKQQEKVVEPPPLPDTEAQPGDTVIPPGTTLGPVADKGDIAPPDRGEPLTGAHLEYAANPAPSYPSSSLRANEQGTVMLEVLVDVDGRPIDVRISRSSGYRALDAAARRQVLANWRFRPAMRNGVAVQAIGIVPVEFKLD
ncbi:energy transducer TonB [Lysobacter sp. TY2-98]|uniref:energy transducer TonB n=1 Tax=Lysobacter sp. TY2-98 TaxID=2290922 RepID=UPI000E204036|nr:energy transducer TonB [Lysobacter sp. TY2-98]AXK71556.1 energy transducer TonB [Lysobacter sp. TY2-98]